MEKKLLFFCLVCIAFSGRSLGQILPSDSVERYNPRPNAVYGEFLGSGLFVSLNYERFFRMPGTGAPAAFRVGLIIIPEGTQEYSFHSRTTLLFPMPIELILPSEKSWKFGQGRLRSEWGLGFTLFNQYTITRGINGDKAAFLYTSIMPNGRFSCKWQPDNKAFFMKAGFTVFIIPDFNIPLIPVPGLAFGYSFGRKKN